MGIKTVTRLAVVAAALALAACGPKGDSAKTGSEGGKDGGGVADALFPKRTASYEAKYQIKSGQAGALDMTMYASGAKRRMDMTIPGLAITRATVIDPETQTYIGFSVGPNAPKTATKLNAGDLKQFDRFDVDPNAVVKPKKVGSDTIAGLPCAIWEVAAPKPDPAAPDPAPLQMCVTDDGIMLRSGTAEAPQMLATEVNKGPQDAALFVIPAGYSVVDMGDCMAVMQQYGEAMRNGGANKPDQAKFDECQKKLMSSMGAP